ncbi:MAG TPA: hypothetical protein VFH50_00740 [Acidimicrobiales bacterium]|nr:hypothetical protein [Acidimicrobiales bacterium]
MGLVVAVVLVWAVVSLRRAVADLTTTVRAVRETAEDVRSETVPVLLQMRGIAERTEAELVRMDGLLETAASISSTVDSASHLAYLAFSNPLIKALAFGSGTGRALSRFRRSREQD